MSKTQKSRPAVDTIWFTRCAGGGRGGVPTASGIAYKLGWLEEEFRDEEGVQKILQGETGASAAGVAAAYRSGFHLSLAPDLSDERLDLFRQQKDFLLAHGILDRDFDFDAWIDRRPLEEAARTLEEARAVA